MPPHQDYPLAGAYSRLRRLMLASGITRPGRLTAASRLLATHCKVIEAQTQYLCWAKGRPGDMIFLNATYTQADSPMFRSEHEDTAQTESATRLRWRNARMREYARYNIFPFHYAFNAPAYADCQSYYFSLTPPDETRIVLLDWGSGRRYRTTAPAHVRERSAIADVAVPPDGMASEVDSASFTYHFHNRRAVRRPVPSDQRKRSYATYARVHAFVRPDPFDSGKLAAVGLLGLVLAILAERGTLFNASNGGTSQWLLLAPAALVLYIGQQRRHHYARFTRRYRLWLWSYTIVATFFAASIAFGTQTFSLIPGGDAETSRLISALFALISVVLIVSAVWGGNRFDRVTRRRHSKVLDRVHIFGTPSLVEEFKEFRRRRRYWRRPTAALLLEPDPRPRHPSDRAYTAIARHSIDRLLGGLSALCVIAILAMTFHVFHWHWGSGEACAISRQEAQQAATEEGVPPGRGHCEGGTWVEP